MQSLDVGNERIQSLQMEVDLKSEQVEIMANEMETKLSMTKSEIAELKSKVTEGMMIKEKAILLEKEKTEALMQARTLKETYDKLVEKLKHELDSKEATLKGFERKLTITLIDRILFDCGRASLNQEGKTTLDKGGQALKDSLGTKLRVSGHTDDVPIAEGFRYKFPSNWELSAARASAVARFFHEKNGIEPKKMEVVGKSFYHPLSDNTTQEGRSKNRRVEIAIIPE